MKTNVIFLSLGAGAPEQLTLGALSTLRAADLVVVPATKSPDGSLSSRAATIIGDYCSRERMRLYALPMQQDRQSVHAVYDQICQDVSEAYRQGLRVVVVVEGDVSIYASIHYVMDHLQQQGVAVTQWPGIPSFVAAAAMAGLSLVSGKQRLTILPGDADSDTLGQLLAHNHVVVVMKLSQCKETVKAFLQDHPTLTCHYFENVGTPQAFHTTDLPTILGRPVPYFSLCILYPSAV